MTLHQFCQEMGFGQDCEYQLYSHWDELIRHSSDSLPEFMQRQFYAAWLPLCGIDPLLTEEILARMDRVAGIVSASPVCARYASMIHYAFFRASPVISMSFLPPPEKILGENAGIFQLMCALSSLPLIQDRHRELGLPAEYLPAAAQWFAGTVQIYQAAHNGIPGFTLQQIGWLRHHINGVLFRIGRLEYLMGSWRYDLPAVFRHRCSGELAVLCGRGWKMSSRGEHLSDNARDYDWITNLQEQDGSVTGFPIDESGYPQKQQPRTLSLQEWSPLISPWDMIPSIHIPGGGGMTMEAVRTSMQEAVKFFRQYFHTDLKGFVCNSWILNPAWQKELPSSNMAKLQRNVHMLPPEPGKTCGLFFVYGVNEGDPRSMQRTSSLHEAFCRIYDRGESLQYGGMFILTEEISHIGEH